MGVKERPVALPSIALHLPLSNLIHFVVKCHVMALTDGSSYGYDRLTCFPLLTPRFSEFGLIGAIHSISTLPMSHCKYNEWLRMVEIGILHV